MARINKPYLLILRRGRWWIRVRNVDGRRIDRVTSYATNQRDLAEGYARNWVALIREASEGRAQA